MLPHILAEPLFLQIWISWFVIVNSASLFFLRHAEARWVLAAWLVNLAFMTALFELNGYNRLLGLSHVLIWTPLLVYLYRRRSSLMGDLLFGKWARTLFLTNLLSLVVDYVDVVRFVSGDRS